MIHYCKRIYGFGCKNAEDINNHLCIVAAAALPNITDYIGELEMKTVVITGATGAIGRALLKICIESGYEVLTVVHRKSIRAVELESMDHCHVLKLDLSEYDHAMDEMEKQGIELENYELFFHLAWMASFGEDRDNLDLQIDNIRAASTAVRFAKELGCGTFIIDLKVKIVSILSK